MGRSIRPIVAAALLALACSQAQAALITTTYDFSATDWFNVPPSPPVSTLEGSVTLTFNTSDTSLTERTSGITLNSLNVSLGSALGFIYDPNGFLSGLGLESMLIGGIADRVTSVSAGSDDFGLLIRNPSSSNPSLDVALLSTASPPEFWRSHTGTVSSLPASSIPGPPTLPLLGLGLAGLLALRRLRDHS